MHLVAAFAEPTIMIDDVTDKPVRVGMRCTLDIRQVRSGADDILHFDAPALPAATIEAFLGKCL